MPYQFPPHGACPICSSGQGPEADTVIAATERAVCLVPPVLRSTGAVVVFPRRHVVSALDLDEREAAEVARLTQLAARAVEAAYDPAGLNVWWAIGELAGQTVEHLLVEVAPRYEDVPYKYLEWNALPSWSLAARREVADRLRAAL